MQRHPWGSLRRRCRPLSPSIDDDDDRNFDDLTHVGTANPPRSDSCGGALDAWGGPCALQVVLFQDAFVCRHVNKANQWVEGFAQPYDAESRYFLACVDEGRIPDGLSDLIALRPRDGTVLVEVRDHRSCADELCPVSSAFLSCEQPVHPTSECACKNRAGVPAACRLWRNLLQPGKSSSNSSHSSSSVLGLDQTADNMMLPFDESIAMSQDQLEALAMDAMPLFLESEVMSPRLMDVEPFPSPAFLSATPAASSTVSHEQQLPRRPLARVQPRQAPGSRLPAQSLTWHEASARAESVSRMDDSENELSDTGSDCGTAGEKLSELRITVPRDDMDFEDVFGDSSPVGWASASKHSQLNIPARRNAERPSPLPGTFQFMEKLKGKKRRRISVPAELSYGSPSWKNRGHLDHFFRAATSFERQHAISLQINLRRLTLVDAPPSNEAQLSPGGMLYIAHALQDWRMPTEVIAAHATNAHKGDEELSREFARSAMIDPARDPIFSVEIARDLSPSSRMEALQLQ